jgi:hypothetical protein
MVGNDRVDAKSKLRPSKRRRFLWLLGHKPNSLGKTDMVKGDTKTLFDTNRSGEATDFSQIPLFLSLFRSLMNASLKQRVDLIAELTKRQFGCP